MYPTKKLSQVWTITTWYTPSKGNKEFWGGKTLFIKPPHLRTDKIITETEETLSDLWRKKWKLIKKNSIMVCCIWSLWKIWIAWDNVCTNQQINSIFFDENTVDFKYWYYFCTTLEKRMKKMANKAIVAIINKTTFSKIEIPTPPLFTQSRIVARLDSAFANIDEQISLLRANIEDVESLKFGIIEKIFEEGDFEIKALKDVCERIMDGTHFSPKNSDSWDRLYVSAKNIKLHGVDLTKATYISQEDHDIIYKRCPVKKWDVLYIKDGATTWISTINQLDEEFSLLSSVAVFQVKKNILSEQFLNYYLNSSFGKKHMISMMWWAAITRLTLTKLNSGRIPLPPLARQHEIVAHLDQVFQTTCTLREEYEAQIGDLETLKQSLLEEAFAGRLITD